LAVSRHSAHPQEAVKLVRFLLHAQIESIEKRRREYENQPAFYKQDQSDSTQRVKIVHRPSIETGSRYTQVSAAYAAALHSVLMAKQGAPEAAAELEKRLIQITGFHTGPPHALQ
jgi:trehalose/maltose transport system substrate-binding protein